MNKNIFYTILVISMIGCSSSSIPKNTTQINVSYSWRGIQKCSYTSPLIQLSNVPKGTTLLNIQMDDLNRPSNIHGGGNVRYSGSNTIPQGALHNFKGPCPPSGEHHIYKIIVKAQDAKGKIIGYGATARKF